jgi:hypothetical protein
MIEWLQNAAVHDQFWTIAATLLGVFVGFFLNEGWQAFKEWRANRRLKNALYDELDILLNQIEHKKDIVSKMRHALEEGRLLNGEGVPCASVVYDNHFASITEHLDPIERDNAHNIYTRLKANNSFLANFEGLFKSDLEGEVIEDPWKAYDSKLADIIQDYDVAQALIQNLLEDKPEDIYQRRSQSDRANRRFAGKVTPEVIRGEKGT